MSAPIIADSSGLISLLFPTDSNNASAVRISNVIVETNRRLILPGEVFTETINTIGKKEDHKKAIRVGMMLLTSGRYIIVETVKDLRDAAFDMFKKQPKSVSFTDCLVMAVADHLETKDIFGFDEAFRKNGYVRIGIDKPHRSSKR